MTRPERIGELAERMQAEHPERYARVRSACQWAAKGIVLDHHAALVVQQIAVVEEGRNRKDAA